MDKNKLEIYDNGDVAGLIPESELVELAEMQNSGAGITISSWACGAAVAITLRVCPTSSCTKWC
ncbi:MAG: class II lanthipeptide, LchA2/BrtA2 family [Clostridium tyrobutyricum]|jgi:hypothetical protein|uniref:class II lanthipeptide, LchA2/BrtA2 family n=1 Tax=Clostridium tyrobutyricum TaxID=1519 RepID=UPI0024328543|nr:class II lanthipeptide, LchA2/BrtA2 family [Clostridium tyrobutyricum]MCH4259342.1 class II lanthipeptide, LchA2/BrtA2 family [Clostridium tyrobutyricum]